MSLSRNWNGRSRGRKPRPETGSRPSAGPLPASDPRRPRRQRPRLRCAGYERDQSPPGAILRRWFARSFEVVTSDPLIAEVERTLGDPYFAARVSVRIYDLAVTAFKQQATRTAVTEDVSGVATHPEDDL